MLVAGLVMTAGTANAGTITVELTPSESQVTIDETIEVFVRATIEAEILGFGFDLLGTGPLLDVVDVTYGDAFSPLPTSDDSALAALAFPEKVRGEDILLATITLAARETGTAELDLGITPDDLTQGFPEVSGFADVTTSSALVEILDAPLNDLPLAGSNSVPEPTGLALACVAGTFLGLFGRRRIVDAMRRCS